MDLLAFYLRNRHYAFTVFGGLLGFFTWFVDLIDPNKLAPLPSYKRFVEDLESALRQIGYIR